MDYKEKYEKAIGRAEAAYGTGAYDDATLEFIFPQLRESENERIRKRIRLCLYECVHSDIIRDYERDECLSWLEKQKEQKPAEWSEVELEFRGEKVKVKRPFFRDDKGRGYSTTEQDEDVAWYALRAWCEKKGVSLYDLYPREEWSEEDEKIRNAILEFLNPDKGGTKYSSNANLVWWSNWLKSIPERFSLQPKQEWSKEDEDAITTAIRACRYMTENFENSTKQYEDAIERLKSLCPQPKAKWSEEDEKMRCTCIDLLEHFPRPCGEVIGPWKDCISWLKSLRPSKK